MSGILPGKDILDLSVKENKLSKELQHKIEQPYDREIVSGTIEYPSLQVTIEFGDLYYLRIVLRSADNLYASIDFDNWTENERVFDFYSKTTAREVISYDSKVVRGFETIYLGQNIHTDSTEFTTLYIRDVTSNNLYYFQILISGEGKRVDLMKEQLY